ncbi:MAG TPA: CDP-alcohol phosphatidyltransferase family protein [Streptosporangiaceae bacterium]|jgi:CDP-diacylglycerol--glycerol-3-phosphate 3-phosphatidyltransferase
MLNLLRPQLARVTEPAGRALARTGITPNTITIVGALGVAVGGLGFFTRGSLFWGTVIITVAVLLDLLDGALARVTGTSGAWGAFLDSTLDRVADALIFGSLVWWLSGGGHDRVLAGVALFCLVAGAVVSYAKARAEGLGLTCNVGIAERGERLLLVLVPTGLSGLGVPYVLDVGLWVLAVLSAITVGQRIAEVRRQLPAGRGGTRD